jgi:hypothetical protein
MAALPADLGDACREEGENKRKKMLLRIGCCRRCCACEGVAAADEHAAIAMVTPLNVNERSHATITFFHTTASKSNDK